MSVLQERLDRIKTAVALEQPDRIPENARLENVQAMVSAALEYGNVCVG
jgi:hypothetical protein